MRDAPVLAVATGQRPPIVGVRRVEQAAILADAGGQLAEDEVIQRAYLGARRTD